jgi:hypothetical protein
MTQYVINIGAIPNDGTGDPLRTAFNETNLNFDQVFAAGPVLSNIQIANNTILTTNTNGNLILAPNGTAVVQSNVSIVPNLANLRNLGSSTQRWATIYTQYLNISGTLTTSDLTVDGNLTVQGNIIQVGNIVTETLTIQLGNAATTGNAANGAGITVGANDNIATVLYNSTGNVWTTNIGLSSVGNITAPYFFGNGSQLTGVTSSYGNANVVTLLAGFGANTISTTGNITGGFIFGNISQATGFPSGYANANAVAYGESGWAGNIIPSGNAVYSLGNATNQWNDLYVSNATIYMNNVPISLSAGNVLTVNGNAVLQNNSNSTISTTGNITSGNVLTGGIVSATGNVTGNYFIGNGSRLTGLSTSSISNGTSNVDIATANGNVSITANGSSTWNFDNTGNLTVPGIIQGSADSDYALKLGAFPEETAAGRWLQVRSGDVADHIHLDTSNNSAWNFYLGSDNQYVLIGNTGNISIGSCDLGNNTTYQWTFDNTGATIFPTLTVTRGDRTGTLTGSTILIGDGTQEAILTTPDGVDGSDSQRLVINPGAGSEFGEGGDIYLYSGRGGASGGSGGDIKIRGGLGPVDGYGGYIDIVGGEAAGNGVAGYIDIQGGQSAGSTGGYVRITGGQGVNGAEANLIGGVGTAGPGGAVNIAGGTSSNGVAEYGNVNIPSGASTWTFNNTGNLVLPGTTFAVNYSDGTPVSLGSGNTISNGTSNVTIPTANGNVTVNVGEAVYNFDSGGNLTLPNGFVVGSNGGAADIATTYDLDITANAISVSAGANITMQTLNPSGIPSGVYNWQGQGGWNQAFYGNLATTGGTGTGLTVDVAAGGSGYISINQITIATPGTGYTAGDVITIDNENNLPGTFQITVSASGWTFDNTGNLTAPGVITANTFVSNAFNVVTAGNLSITSQYGLGVTGTILENGGTLELIGNGTGAGTTGCVVVGWNSSYGTAGNVAQMYFNPADSTGNIVVTTGNTAGTSYAWTFNKTGTLTAPGNVSAVGNITGNYILGNGSQLTGLPATYGNANVATFLAAYGSNTISTSGNVTAGNIIGNINITGNVQGTSSNVTLVAGSYSWTFDNTGNTQGNLSLTGGNITINNAPGGNEGAEIKWALPAPANTVLSTSLVQDVFQNGMRFFEAGGNNRGLYMDLGNVPNGSTTAVGYRDIPQVSFTGNTTIATTDAGRHYYSTQSTSYTLTIANNASQGFQVGAAITVVNQGTGNITVAQGSGVTLYLAGNATLGNRTISTFGMATLIKVATDTWFINGTGVS